MSKKRTIILLVRIEDFCPPLSLKLIENQRNILHSNVTVDLGRFPVEQQKESNGPKYLSVIYKQSNRELL